MANDKDIAGDEELVDKYWPIFKKYGDIACYLSELDLQRLSSAKGWRIDLHDGGGWFGPYLRIEDGMDAEQVAYLMAHAWCETDEHGHVVLIRMLADEEDQAIDTTLEAVATLEHVQHLRIEGRTAPLEKKLSDKGLICLKNWKRLRDVNLHGQAFTGEGLLRLVKSNPLRELEEITLSGITQADLALESLKDATNLRALRVYGDDASDAGLRHLQGLAEIEELVLNYNPITGVGFRDLTGLRSLRRLSLEDATINDEGIACIVAQFNRLEELIISGSQLTDAGAVYLAELCNLKMLALSRTSISRDGIEHLVQLSDLERLSVRNTSLGDEVIPVLSRFKSLKSLSVAGSKISDAGKERLRQALPDCKL